MAVRVGDSRPIRGFIRELILVSIFWLNSCRIDESAKQLLSSFVSSTGFRFCTLLFEIKYFFTPSPYFSTMAPFFPQSKQISIPTTKAAAQKGKNSKGRVAPRLLTRSSLSTAIFHSVKTINTDKWQLEEQRSHLATD